MRKFKVGNRVKNKRGQEGSVVAVERIKVDKGRATVSRYEVKNGNLRFWGFDHTLELVGTNKEKK